MVLLQGVLLDCEVEVVDFLIAHEREQERGRETLNQNITLAHGVPGVKLRISCLRVKALSTVPQLALF